MQKLNCKENIFSVPDVYLICAYINVIVIECNEILLS